MYFHAELRATENATTIPFYLKLVYVDGTSSGSLLITQANETSFTVKEAVITPAKPVDWIKISHSGAGKDSLAIKSLMVSFVDSKYEPYKEPQTLTVSTPNGLRGVPVTTGGNYTDSNGQQWICDEVDFERGVYIKRIEKKVFNTIEGWNLSSLGADNPLMLYHQIHSAQPNDCAVYCNIARGVSFNDVRVNMDNSCYLYAAGNLFCMYTSTINTLSAFSKFLTNTPLEVIFVAQTPVETPLTAEELKAYALLRTNKPNTTVYNDAGAWQKLTYFADTKLYIDNKFAELQNAILATGANI